MVSCVNYALNDDNDIAYHDPLVEEIQGKLIILIFSEYLIESDFIGPNFHYKLIH